MPKEALTRTICFRFNSKDYSIFYHFIRANQFNSPAIFFKALALKMFKDHVFAEKLLAEVFGDAIAE